MVADSDVDVSLTLLNCEREYTNGLQFIYQASNLFIKTHFLPFQKF